MTADYGILVTKNSHIYSSTVLRIAKTLLIKYVACTLDVLRIQFIIALLAAMLFSVMLRSAMPCSFIRSKHAEPSQNSFPVQIKSPSLSQYFLVLFSPHLPVADKIRSLVASAYLRLVRTPGYVQYSSSVLTDYWPLPPPRHNLYWLLYPHASVCAPVREDVDQMGKIREGGADRDFELSLRDLHLHLHSDSHLDLDLDLGVCCTFTVYGVIRELRARDRWVVGCVCGWMDG